MKAVLVLLSVAVCAYGASVPSDAAHAETIAESNDQSPDGSFHYGAQTSNGIQFEVDGKVKQLTKDEVALEVQGSSQYQSPEGENVQLTYVANENGFQPQGPHLPTPPPPEAIPDYILRSLEYIKAHPYTEKA